MGTGGPEATREALTTTLAAALRQNARHSVHPADQQALRCTAARIALALEAEFRVVARDSSVSELADDPQLSEAAHE